MNQPEQHFQSARTVAELQQVLRCTGIPQSQIITIHQQLDQLMAQQRRELAK
jgi:hypothetical protein